MIVVKEGLAAERRGSSTATRERTVRRAARSARRAEFRRARQWCARRDRRRASAARRAARRPAARRAGRGRTRAARNAARRPMKPMMPAHDTSAPTASATATSTRRFSRCTGTPRCSASVSPSCNAFSASRSRASSMQPIATHGATAASADHCAPPRLPRLQKVSERNCASSATNVRLIAAPTSALIAMPASSSSGSASRPRDAASR